MKELYEDYRHELVFVEMILEMFRERREKILDRLKELRSNGFY